MQGREVSRRPRGRRAWLAGLSLALALAAVLVLAARASGWGTSPDVVAEGAGLFSANCVSCHGDAGTRIPMVPLSSRAYLDQLGDSELVTAISNGKNSMPGFAQPSGQLSADQIEAIVRYLWAPQGPAGKVATPTPDDGHQLYLDDCSNCHGLDGTKLPQAKIGSEAYVNSRGEASITRVIQTGQGGMPAFASTLQPDQVKAVVAYLRTIGSTAPLASPTQQPGSSLAIPHPVEDRLNGCVVCHGPNGLVPFPADHAGRSNGSCLGCHKASATVEQVAATVPRVPHDVKGREECLTCHGANGMVPVPADHRGRTKDSCLGCHQATQISVAGGTPRTPHELTGREDCLSCHKIGFLQPMPADHAGRPADQCQSCHKPGQAGASSPAPQITHDIAGADDCLRCHGMKASQ